MEGWGEMIPKRIQRKREKGWKMPEGAIYVGRPTKWGNPFTGRDAVERYRRAIMNTRLFPGWKWGDDAMREWTGAGGDWLVLVGLASGSWGELEELRGHDLACWCPLDKPCHADVLLIIANDYYDAGNPHCFECVCPKCELFKTRDCMEYPIGCVNCDGKSHIGHCWWDTNGED